MNRATCPGSGSVRPSRVRRPALQLQRKREAHVRNERKRMRRIDRKRRQHRIDVVHELRVEPLPVGFRLVPCGSTTAMPALRSSPSERSHTRCCSRHQIRRRRVDRVELLLRPRGRRRTASSTCALTMPSKAGDAHHVELVEVGCRNRQEAQALEQRMALVLGLFQHARVEGKPRQLAIDQPLRRRRIDGLGVRARFAARGRRCGRRQ